MSISNSSQYLRSTLSMSLRICKNISLPYTLALMLTVGAACAATNLSAQTIIQTIEQADSLRRVIATVTNDTTRINAMNELAYYLADEKNLLDSAQALARNALAEAERCTYKVGVASALNNIGKVYEKQKKMMEAIRYYSQSLRISEDSNDKKGIAASLRLLGYAHNIIGKFSEALVYSFKALPMEEALGNKRNLARLYTLVGFVYAATGKYTDALEYNFKALRAFEAIGLKTGVAGSLQIIGSRYRDLHLYEQALEYQFKALRIYQDITYQIGVVSCQNQIGNIYNRNGQFAQALDYLFQALENSKASGLGDRPYILDNIVVAFRGQRRFDSALVVASRSVVVADSLGIPEYSRDALKELSQTLDSLGRYKESLRYYKRYVTIKDSLINLETLNKTSQLKEAYEAEKREQQIALLTKGKSLQQSELTRQQAELARSRAEQELQHKSILLLSNEKDLPNSPSAAKKRSFRQHTPATSRTSRHSHSHSPNEIYNAPNSNAAT